MKSHCPTAALILSAALCLWSGCENGLTAPSPASPDAATAKGASRVSSVEDWPVFNLKAAQTWQINLPDKQQMDASGLAFNAKGDLLTVNDRGPTVYRIQFRPGEDAADLVALPTCFTPPQLAPFAREKLDRYDTEGIALDDAQRIYICDEPNRWILRCDPVQGAVERLPIDWAPVKKYFSGDPNASFEGVAVGGGRLYAANERQMGRIIAVEMESWKVVDDFSVRALGSNARDVHYSDLSYFDGVLYVLLRESYCVLAVDPADHRVLAQYNYRDLERAPEVLYRSLFPTGQMEGLAVNADSLWLVTDNNGTPRARHPTDTRPTLFKCQRPTFKR